MSALPAAIGRYRPTALLGTGVMGTVYQAHDPTIDRMVAIKVVLTEALDAETRADFIDRFRSEVQAAARCAHPAIVAVYDFIGDAGNPAIVMELVEGLSLQRILHDGATRPAGAVAILQQVLGGLGYAHGQGVTHRDIKPANILVTRGGQAKIADFGIARLSEASLTQTGAMLGTPSYMAPEQVNDAAVDRRADLFAVGAILYEACVGRPPFAGRTISETLHRLCGPQAADLAAVAPSALLPVLRVALAKNPAQRFQTADEFAAALTQAGAAADPSAATVILGPPPARRWDPAVLQRVERQLAQYLGPAARTTVARAAAEASDAEQLFARVAESLRTAHERSALLRALGASRVEPTLSGRKPSETTPTVTVAGAVSPAATMAAQTALAHFVGPIARLLVRDAAAQAVSASDFVDRVCAHVTKPTEVAALRRRLGAG